jgi:gamma-glutamyltranspeptidase/glutathione hydrolase
MLEASVSNGLRQFTGVILAVALTALAGCSSGTAPAPGAYGVEPGFVGAVVADEPQAALIGRDVLRQGGTAADAAIAMYFAMAVTLPSQAALGGGGVCISFNPATNEAQSLEFLARPPAVTEASGDRPTAVPGNVRGMFALHGIYGRLRWAQLLAPAENLARFGFPVSRTLAADMAEVEGALAAEPQVRRIFSGPEGALLVREGDRLVQPDLARALALIRTNGPTEFYTGKLADEFLAGVQSVGGTLERTDLALYQPVWRRPLQVGYDDRKAYFTPPPPAGGGLVGQVWAILVKDSRWLDAQEGLRDAVLVDAGRRAFTDRPLWGRSPANPQELVSSDRIDMLIGEAGAVPAPSSGAPPQPENPATATFVALDREGAAVACSVTLNSLFGTGRVAEGTGIVLAALPGPGGRGAAMLGPMLVVQPRGRQFVFAGAAAGGVAAPTALADVAARALLAEQPLDAATSAPRMHSGSVASIVYSEPGASAASLQALANRGWEIVTTPKLGRVNAILCPEGMQSSPELCVAGTDPRGLGLAVTAD